MQVLLRVLAFSALLAGCADDVKEEAAVRADPSLELHQKADEKLTCDQVDAEVSRMNARITLAQRMTDQEVNNRKRLDKPNVDARVYSETAEGLVPLPALGTSGTYATTGNDATANEVLVVQKGAAEAAIARANELIRIGKARKCYAS